MTGISWPIDAPSPQDHEYMTFSMQAHNIIATPTGKLLTEEDVSERFAAVHGYPPEWIVAEYCGYCWVGPIREADESNPPYSETSEAQA